MSKRNNQASTTTDLRADADAKVATWRELVAVVEAKRAEAEQLYKDRPLPDGTYRGGLLLRPSDTLLAHLNKQIVLAEAEERAATAERAAVLALDAAELAEGDESARARELPALRDDLVALYDDIDRAKAELVAAQQHLQERTDRTVAATVVVAHRRRAADLPFASSGFAPRTLQLGAAFRAHLTAVDEAIARGIKIPGHAAVIADLRAQRVRCAAELEASQREKAAEAKHTAQEKAWREKLVADEQRAVHAKERENSEARESERKHREELAAAHLARLGVSA